MVASVADDGKWPEQNLNVRHVFPTPESPMTMILRGRCLLLTPKTASRPGSLGPVGGEGGGSEPDLAGGAP